MPYQVYKSGEKYCVHKKNPDGSKGKRIACHDSENKAKRQMRAIYASENAKKDKSLTNPYNTNLARLAFYAPMAGGYSLDSMGIAEFIGSVYDMLGLDSDGAEPVTAMDVEEYIQQLSDIFYSYHEDDTERAIKSFNLRRALMVTSNAYEDREGEILKEKALSAYVEHSWDGDTFVGNNPLYVWHGGDPIGQIVYADMIGPFLLEIAQERPDTTINLAESGQSPIKASVKSVWDALAETPDLRASHRFGHILGDERDGAYDRIFKIESSVLSGAYPANWWTYFKVL
jgi:hypothetical protein